MVLLGMLKIRLVKRNLGEQQLRNRFDNVMFYMHTIHKSDLKYGAVLCIILKITNVNVVVLNHVFSNTTFKATRSEM